MKKLFTLVALAAINMAAFAQKEIEFKVDYKPKSTYAQKMNMDMNIDMIQSAEGSYEEGDTANQAMIMIIESKLITSAADKNKNIPFTAEITLESEMIPAMGSNFEGKIVNGNIDAASLTATDDTNPEVAEKLKESLGKMLSQFPATPTKMKVGDTFKTNKMPMDMGGINLGADTNTSITYTLKKIEGKKAYFDLALDTPFNMTTQGITVTGTLKMGGNMVYETEGNYVSSQLMDMIANFKMNQGGIEIKIDMTAKTTTSTTVTPN